MEHYLFLFQFVLVSIRLLNGTVLESFVRPAVLITDAYNALLSNQPPRRQRDQQFLGNDTIHRFTIVLFIELPYPTCSLQSRPDIYIYIYTLLAHLLNIFQLHASCIQGKHGLSTCIYLHY